MRKRTIYENRKFGSSQQETEKTLNNQTDIEEERYLEI